MASYAHCWLDGLLIGSTRNFVHPDLISLFNPTDKIVLSPPIEISPPHVLHHKEWLVEDPESRLIYYETNIGIVRDRLEILGYDLETSKSAFCDWRRAELEGYTDRIRELRSDEADYVPIMIEFCNRHIDFLERLTPDIWVNALRSIRSNESRSQLIRTSECFEKSDVIGQMQSREWHGAPGEDVLVALRMAIECADHTKAMIYDLSDLVWGDGVDDYSINYVEYGQNVSAEEYRNRAKTVVLTEGRTDAWILEESLRVLFPHLIDYYSILDFSTAAYGGGVGNLANVVKALSGADLANNFVAVFDNDTASSAACKKMTDEALPSNIEIVRLPEMEFLKYYPTLGPNGQVECDINGLAASIELYLGKDVLGLEGGQFMPIQWMGYEKGLRQYQGEILDKDTLHKRFRRKLAESGAASEADWEPLRRVWRTIFSAFRRKRRRTICSLAKEHYGG